MCRYLLYIIVLDARPQTASPKRTSITLFVYGRGCICAITYICIYKARWTLYTHEKKPLEVFHPWFGNSSRNNRKVLRSLCMRPQQQQQQSGAPLGPQPHCKGPREGGKNERDEENGRKLLRHYTVSGPSSQYYYCEYIIIRPATGQKDAEREWKNFYTLVPWSLAHPRPTAHSPQITYNIIALASNLQTHAILLFRCPSIWI